MKLLSLAIALSLSLSLPLSSVSLHAAESQTPSGNTPPIEAPNSVLTPDLYVIHAIHLANLSANRAVIGSYLAPATQAIREQGFAILGRSARIDIFLSFLAKPYGIDFAVDLLPDELSAEKDLIDKAIESLNTSDELTVEDAYINALAAVKDLETRIIDYTATHDVSQNLKDFVRKNLQE